MGITHTPLDMGVAVFPAATAKVFGALFGLLVFEFKFLNCGLKALYELFQFQGFRLQFNDVRGEESSLGKKGLGPGVDVGLVDRGHWMESKWMVLSHLSHPFFQTVGEKRGDGGVYGEGFDVMPGTPGTAVHPLVDLST